MNFNKIMCADAASVASILEPNSIDLVITSPPYNVDLGNNKYNKSPYDVYIDNKSHGAYLNWLTDVFCNIHHVLKTGGRVCINIGDGKNGAIPTHANIITGCVPVSWIPMTQIVWDKGTTSNRAAWGSFCSPSCPSFPRSFEYILIFAKEQIKLPRNKYSETDLSKEEFIKWSNGLWKVKPETQMKKWGHPAMFPVEIPHRLIKMLSWKNSTVLDPFCGAGTTCVAAKQLERKYVGIDISTKYCKTAEKRLINV